MPISKDPVMRAKQIAQLRPSKKGEVRNPHGRKRNPLTQFIEEAKREGYHVATKDEIKTAISLCTSQDEEGLKKLLKDKSIPMLIRIVARKMLGDGGFEATMKLIENVYGKSLDITSNGKEIKPEPIQIEVITKSSQVEKKDKE